MHSFLTLSFPFLLPSLPPQTLCCFTLNAWTVKPQTKVSFYLFFVHVCCCCKKQLAVRGHIYVFKSVFWQSEMLQVVCVCWCVSVCSVAPPQEWCQTTDFSDKPHWGLPQEVRPRRAGGGGGLIIFISRLLCKVWNSGSLRLCEFLWILIPAPLQSCNI